MIVKDFFKSYREEGKKGLGVLVDPDKFDLSNIEAFCKNCTESKVDFILVGSSFLYEDLFADTIKKLKENLDIPVVIFPGNAMQLSPKADAVLYLSLLSGRNARWLIEEHVHAAPKIFKSKLETVPTGYILVDSGKRTAVEFMSNTTPIPRDKPEIVAAHALAGEQLGMGLIYLEGGSGAENPIPTKVIMATRQFLTIPLMVGGGIRDVETAVEKLQAGADFIIVGNHFENEENLSKLKEFTHAIHSI